MRVDPAVTAVIFGVDNVPITITGEPPAPIPRGHQPHESFCAIGSAGRQRPRCGQQCPFCAEYDGMPDETTRRVPMCETK